MDKNDISNLQIDASKMRANGSKYFELFEKHIPRKLGKDRNVLIYKICNLSCIVKIIDLNPTAHYIVVGNESCNNALKIILEDNINIEYYKEFDFKENDMKFDCIIMNPPYDGQTNLYGKLTLEAKKHANIVICLSPYLNYISNKLSFKDISNKLEQYLTKYEPVETNIFDAAFDKQLCIFKFSNNRDSIFKFENLFWNKFSNVKLAKSILSKLKTKNDYCNLHTIEYSKFDNYPYKCIMTFKRGHFNKQNGKPNWDWTTLFSKEYQTRFDWKSDDIKTANCQAIPFNTEIECKNFCDYCNSDIIAFIIFAYKVSLSQSSNLQYIPYLTTYTKPWTDDMISREFNLTNEEINYIHTEMKSYGWKTQCKHI